MAEAKREKEEISRLRHVDVAGAPTDVEARAEEVAGQVRVVHVHEAAHVLHGDAMAAVIGHERVLEAQVEHFICKVKVKLLTTGGTQCALFIFQPYKA